MVQSSMFGVAFVQWTEFSSVWKIQCDANVEREIHVDVLCFMVFNSLGSSYTFYHPKKNEALSRSLFSAAGENNTEISQSGLSITRIEFKVSDPYCPVFLLL